MAVFTPVFSGWVLDSALGPLDRVLGFVFGVARGALLVVVAYMLYGALIGDPQTRAADRGCPGARHHRRSRRAARERRCPISRRPGCRTGSAR